MQQKKKVSINFGKILLKFCLKFCLSLPKNGTERYLYVNETEIRKFKANDNIRWYNFCLGNVSKDFTKDKQGEISLNGTVYNFSVAHSLIKKEDILIIHQYLMIKNNIKLCLGLLKKYLSNY